MGTVVNKSLSTSHCKDALEWDYKGGTHRHIFLLHTRTETPGTLLYLLPGMQPPRNLSCIHTPWHAKKC